MANVPEKQRGMAPGKRAAGNPAPVDKGERERDLSVRSLLKITCFGSSDQFARQPLRIIPVLFKLVGFCSKPCARKKEISTLNPVHMGEVRSRNVRENSTLPTTRCLLLIAESSPPAAVIDRS